MIEANELRIGNWILHNGKPDKIYAIVFMDSQMNPYRLMLEGSRSKMGVDLFCAESIPLTPEILEKAGFSYDLHTYGNKNIWLAEGSVEGEDDPQVWHVWTNGLSAGITTHVEYLHQLQNLYFALTGQELEIKL